MPFSLTIVSLLFIIFYFSVSLPRHFWLIIFRFLSLSASKNLLSGKNQSIFLTGCEKYLYLGGNMGQVDLLKLGSVDL